MATDYTKLIIPEKWTMLKRPLKALSLGHIILLTRIESPLFNRTAGDDVTITPADILKTILILSKDYDDGLKCIERLNAGDTYWAWRKSYWLLSKPDRLLAYADMLTEYLQESMEAPLIWDDGNNKEDKKSSTASWLAVFKLQFMKLGYSEKEVLNKPFASLVYELMATAEMKGMVDFVGGESVEEAILNRIRMEKKN